MPGPLSNSGYTPGPRRLIAGTTVPWVYSLSDYATGLFIQLVRRPYRATQTNYGSNNPAVVGAATTSTVLFPAHVTVVRTPGQGRQSSYKLRPPISVFPVARATPIRTTLVSVVRQAHQNHYKLSLTPIVASGIVFHAISTTLAKVPQARLHTRSVLNPPILPISALSPVQTKTKTVLAWQRLGHKTISVLGAPFIIGPPIPPFAAIPIKSSFATQPNQLRHVGRFGVAPPQIVDLLPTSDQLIIKTKLVQQPRIAEHNVFVLRRPTIVSAVVSPKYTDQITKTLAASSRLARQTRAKLIPIPLIGSGLKFAPIRVILVRTPKNNFRNHSNLFVPQVLFTIGGTVVTHNMVYLTKYGIY